MYACMFVYQFDVGLDMPGPNEHSPTFCQHALASPSSLLRSVSAGGWDLTGSKGTAMRSDLCDDQRDIPDGRGLFNQAAWLGRKHHYQFSIYYPDAFVARIIALSLFLPLLLLLLRRRKKKAKLTWRRIMENSPPRSYWTIAILQPVILVIRVTLKDWRSAILVWEDSKRSCKIGPGHSFWWLNHHQAPILLHQPMNMYRKAWSYSTHPYLSRSIILPSIKLWLPMMKVFAAVSSPE